MTVDIGKVVKKTQLKYYIINIGTKELFDLTTYHNLYKILIF